MSSNPIFFAPLRVPVTDPATGLMSRDWYLFFQAMFRRVGGTSGASNDDLEQIAIEDMDASGIDAIAAAQVSADAQVSALDASLTDPPSSDATDALMLLLDAQDSAGVGGAPTSKVGLSAIAGSAATLMRSDGAPALDVSISPTWTGNHVHTPGSGIALIVNQAVGAAEAVSIVCQAGGQQPMIMGDGTVATQFTFAGTSLQFGNSSNHPLSLYTNNVTRLTIAAAGGITAAFALSCNGNAPPAQVTGWGTPTGPAVVANFPGATATLVQCSNAIAEIIKDLKAFGLYGA